MDLLKGLMAISIALFSLVDSTARDVYDEFTIHSSNTDVSSFSDKTLRLESTSREFSTVLQPNLDGRVMFSLSDHRYRSTITPKNLYFGVRIEGFKDSMLVNPSINIDASFRDVFLDGNMLIFKQIDFPIPVLFESGVDSIRLHFSNSHGYNFHQYITIDELQVLESVETKANPILVDCEHQSIMVAIQGSDGISKAERKSISKQLRDFFKSGVSAADSTMVSIVEFGRKVTSSSESIDPKEISSTLKDYKKRAKSEEAKSSITNWQSALDEALEKQPDVFILVTNSWSNYSGGGLATINAQHAGLVEKCNEIKANGTRLLFITSGLYDQSKSNTTLLAMLNEQQTESIVQDSLHQQIDLKTVDLISMEGFRNFQMIDLTSLIRCSEIGDEIGMNR